MSKIVIMKSLLAVPTIVEKFVLDIARSDPVSADTLAGLDIREVIEDCVRGSVKLMASAHGGIEIASGVEDYYSKQSSALNSQGLIAAVKSGSLPHGIGIMIDEQNAIKFAVDDYKPEWKAEAERLRKLFEQYFVQEILKAMVTIIGYRLDVHREVIRTAAGEEKAVMTIHAVKEM